MFSFYIILCYFLAINSDLTWADCLINLESSRSKTPIILRNYKTITSDFRNGDVLLRNNEQIQLLCSGYRNHLIEPNIRQFSNATCFNNKFFLHNNNRFYDFTNLICRKSPESTTQQIGTCNINSLHIEIGFKIPNPEMFIKKIEVCYDKSNSITHWTRHELNRSPYTCNLAGQTNFKKDFFRTDVDPDLTYTRQSQYDRGHLTPKCDFFTDAEKKMTFYYINSAPQRKEFNRNNWKELEKVIRKKVNDIGGSFEILTGTAENLGYLNQLVIPKFFWKIVLYRNAGVAFIGVNDIRYHSVLPWSSKCNELNWLGNLANNLDLRSKGKLVCVKIETLQLSVRLPSIPSYRGVFLSNL